MRNKKIVTFIFLIMSFVVPAKVADDEMILIPPGTFQMGNPDGESGDDNYPARSVTIDSFYMCRVFV